VRIVTCFAQPSTLLTHVDGAILLGSFIEPEYRHITGVFEHDGAEGGLSVEVGSSNAGC
jgi:hypothetical protein